MLLPRERIPERTCEQVVNVRVRQVVEQIIEVPVPEMVEQLVKQPKTIPQDRIQQRNVEQIVDVPFPQVVEEPAEFLKVFSQDRVQLLENPAIPLAEKIVELPVIQTEEKTQQSVNTHAQHVVSTVEVERPKIIKQTGQKPIIQEKINRVTKHVEVQLSQFTDKIVDISVVAQRQISMEIVQKSIEIPQLRYCDEVIVVLAVSFVQVPQVHFVKKTVEDPQFEIVEKPLRILRP